MKLHVRFGSSLCENVREQRMRRIVFSLFLFRLRLPVLFFFLFNVIETNFLRASSTLEFSHRLGTALTSPNSNFRSTPKSGSKSDIAGGPVRAMKKPCTAANCKLFDNLVGARK